jgi:hypothetical protein
LSYIGTTWDTKEKRVITVDWSKENWEQADQLFYPKRKINNRRSHFHPHITGYLYSHKMKREVGYESLWGECLFYFLLELDTQILRYYEQPVEVPIPKFNKDLTPGYWVHIPDVLVFRQGSKPMLFQIKGGNFISDEDENVKKACEQYAEKRGWIYSLVRPKAMPEIIKSNLLFLNIYMRPRPRYSLWSEELLLRLKYAKETTIIDLAKSFSAKVDFREILPLIYHLIAKGEVRTDINLEINEKSIIHLGRMPLEINNLFQIEEV